MTETRYLQLSIALPLIIPCIVYLLSSNDLGTMVDLLNGITYGSLILAGVPYAVLAIVTLVMLWGREANAYYKAAKFAPLLFVPVFAIYIYQTELLGRTTFSIQDVLGCLTWSAILVVPVGYTYVFIVIVGAKLLRFSGNDEYHKANT